ncbi:MAG: hypothetical protein KDN05_00465 [Verrucomicrobiae bacterium]|nr:hypothetical protein [Verrucomicrobiae bacterium]
MKPDAESPESQIVMSPKTICAFLALAAIASGSALMQSSCRYFEERSEQVDVRPPLEPRQLVDSLIQSGNDLRRLDELDLEGTADLRTSERTRVQSRISDVANGHARKYRENLLELARLPQNRVNDEIAASLASEKTVRDLPEIVKVIELHLRLVRADTPPSERRIVWDFGNLRYAQESGR